eukprot:scaffold124336_cov63-Phaeocystis_antarctica.AAC.5
MQQQRGKGPTQLTTNATVAAPAESPLRRFRLHHSRRAAPSPRSPPSTPSAANAPTYNSQVPEEVLWALLSL